MITVHHLNNSRSQRILWLLEELGQPYEVKHYQRDRKTKLAPAELRAIHPLGRSPVVTFDDQVLAESGAIIENLCEQFGPELIPAVGTEAHRQYRYWLHFSEGSLMPPLLITMLLESIKSAKVPFFVKPIARGIAEKVNAAYVGPNLKVTLEYIDNHLAENDWFAGEHFSGADIQMSFPLEAALAGGIVDRRHANIQAYVRRFQQRTAYQAALAQGGDYAYA